MRIYLIRHGDPDYPNDSLTPVGRREAQALADHLAEIGLDAIHTSPRGRARLTAQYTVEKLGGAMPITVEPWAGELDGLYAEAHQRALWDVGAAHLRSDAVLADLTRWQAVPPLDHSNLPANLERLQAGSDAFFARLGFVRQGGGYHFEQENRQRIALFAHLGFGLAWLAYLLEIPLPLMWAGFYLHPSSITTILMDERAPGVAHPRVLALGDVSHLYRAGLTPTPAGIIANYE